MPTGSPTACWTRCPGRCSWTRPRPRTCPTWPPPPPAAPASPGAPVPLRGGPTPPGSGTGEPRRRVQSQVRPSIQRILDSMGTTPAFVRNGRLDLVAINPLGRALYAPAFDDPVRPANLARFCFLSPRAAELYPNWDDAADTSVALLRTEAGRDPHNKALTALVGELSTRSREFATRWARHDVRLHSTGVKRFTHPVVGELALAFDAMELPAERGLTLTAYSAEPGTPAEEKLRLLASWSATVDQAETTPVNDRA